NNLIALSRPRKLSGPTRPVKQSMNSEKAIELEGTIMSVLPGTMFRVALANEHLVLAHISGKMRKRFIRLTIGDRVKLHMSPYDIDKARIVYRLGQPAFNLCSFLPDPLHRQQRVQLLNV